MAQDFEADLDDISRIEAIPTILEVVCLTTGMGFAAVARVTEDRWVACSVLDRIDFGLAPGGELKVDTTICDEIRQSREPVVIDHVAQDEVWCGHPTPAMYGFQSYISMPIILAGGEFFGTLCAIDPRPARVKTPQVQGMFRLFAELIAKHLDARKKIAEVETALELARSAIEGNTDCVMVLDLEGHLLSMNQNGCRLMAVDDFAAVASRSWPHFWAEPETGKAAAAFECAREGKEARFTGLHRTTKGNEKYWEVTLSPIVEAHGKPVRILAIARDITVRRVEEAQLRQTARLESLGVLAGGIAHDFNNLLTGILGNAGLLEEISMDREQATLASEIVKAAESAADLTRQMLAYSGKGRFLVERINVSASILAILNLIRTTIDKKVEIVLSLEEDLPMVEGDPGQIQQLIMNLIINASEAMNGTQGKVTVSTSMINVDQVFIAQTFRLDEPSLTEGRYVQIEVRDTGSGMTEETLSKIFDPFFTTKFAGRGLGLAAVSGILRGHRGAVRVYSQPEQGTTFKVFLPLAAAPPGITGPKTFANEAPPHKGWGTILFVDDEEIVRKIGQTALQRSGYDLLVAENGRQAVDLFARHRGAIRLIVLDLTMPVMSGDEAISLLRDIDPAVPILLSSGYNQVEVVRRFTRQNITGFIQKPYTARQLTEALAKVLA